VSATVFRELILGSILIRNPAHLKARIELVTHLWLELQKYVLSRRTFSAVTAIDLEKSVFSWVMRLSKRKRYTFRCLRLAEVPDIGVSGTIHRIDDAILYSGSSVNNGFLVECKATMSAAGAGVLRPQVVAAFVSAALDLCPKVFFRRHFDEETDGNYCVLISMKPLTESAIRFALSSGVIVIQPMIRTLLRSGTVEVTNVAPECLPPEVLWKKLKGFPGVSEGNLKIAESICRHVARTTLEDLFSESCDLKFSKRLKNNEEIFDKARYLTDYFIRSCEDRLP
jgi:hypothetical protein